MYNPDKVSCGQIKTAWYGQDSSQGDHQPDEEEEEDYCLIWYRSVSKYLLLIRIIMIETQAGELKKKKLKMNIITADDLLLSLDINLIVSLPPSQ